MTNQEAVEYLDKYVMNVAPYGKWKEVVELAISALQAQEAKTQLSAEGTTSDLISRQAVIDAIEKNAYRHTYLDQIIDIVSELPSAQPEIIRCKDCIKREMCRTSTTWAVAPKDDWYCADAGRRPDA